MLRQSLLFLLLLALVGSGCSRQFYRRQADDETYAAVQEVGETSRWQLPDYSINIRPDSRMYDPYNPDQPPMPQDDPDSHRYMHWVDGKKGWPYWHRNGTARVVDAGCWRQYLPYNDQGQVVLDMDGAVQLAYRNSRDYQTTLEDLYLSALDVTFERFRFDAQFFGGNSTFFTADGPARPGSGGRSSSLLATDTGLDMRKLYPAGGELVVGLANSIVWQFSGPNTETANTLLDFGLVQPLLRFGGRARVMESLTLRERHLLANVRQMQQFQQGFYTQITTGRDGGNGPTRGPGGRGPAGTGLNLVSGGAAGGYLGLLQEQQQIFNLQTNVAALRDSLALLQAVHDAGRVNLLQVEQARQALYNGQSRLLAARTNYDTRLDAFKIILGLPPDLEVRVEDPLLDQFNLIDPAITRLQDDVGLLLDEARAWQNEATAEQVVELLDRTLELREASLSQVEVAHRDYNQLLANLDQRRAELARLSLRPELETGELSAELYSPDQIVERANRLRGSLQVVEQGLTETWGLLEDLRDHPVPLEDRSPALRLVDLMTNLSGQLLELSLKQAAARLDAVVLVPIDLEPVDAVEIARANRRDWMNARASLVDTWRRIEFDANALQSGMNLVFSGDLRTTQDNPVRFRDATGRLRVGMEFDAPITRLAERNDYRNALINFQRHRRDYMAFEDRINQSLRNTLRIIELNQLNFELRRAAVVVAITQVDLARERLAEPPRADRAQALSPTAARDLVSALTDLLDAQNNFLGIWVSYEVLRRSLDFELGTMQLDERGMWIDPGPIEGNRVQGELPADDELDRIEEILPGDPAPPGDPAELFAPPPPPPQPQAKKDQPVASIRLASQVGTND